jgi:endonuclease/exonuclease/phosphatase family metal-dependent hydrolase
VQNIAPDILVLQNTESLFTCISPPDLAHRVNALGVNSGASHTMAFMSWNVPLRHIKEYDLGNSSKCMLADISVDKERFLIFNVCLKGNFFNRPSQIKKLLGPDLLGRYDMLIPGIVTGDFMDTLWISGHPEFQSRLRRISPPLFRTTFPACCPVLSRDRFYISGGIEVEDIKIDSSVGVRKNFTHLPLIMDMRVHTGESAIRSELKSSGKVGQVLSGSSVFKCN